MILSSWMSSTYLSPSLNFYKQAHSNNNGSVLANLGSVGVWKFGISLLLLSALLPGSLLQHMLRAFICFVGCKRSDPSVLATGKWRSRTEKKYRFQKTLIGAYSATFTVVIATTQGRKHPLLLPLLEQLANVHWFDFGVSVNDTYQEPPPQI